MCDGHLMLQVNWAVVDTIHSKRIKSVVGVKIKAAVDSLLNDSPGMIRNHVNADDLFSTDAEV